MGVGVLVWVGHPTFSRGGPAQGPYRGTSLVRNSGCLGPYSRKMPRALGHPTLSISSVRPSSVSGREGENLYRGTSLIRNSPPPQDHNRALGIVLL